MYNQTLWSKLKPGTSASDDSENELESFNNYMARVAHLVPHVPRNVLEHWIYEHYVYIKAEYIELGIENMRFVQESWDSDRIYNDIKSFKGEELGGMGFHVYEIEDEDDAENWLAGYMRDQRTWPVPIIVLKNAELNLLGEPYHLMEGHRRLDYLREIYQEERTTLKSLHEVWVTEIIK